MFNCLTNLFRRWFVWLPGHRRAMSDNQMLISECLRRNQVGQVLETQVHRGKKFGYYHSLMVGAEKRTSDKSCPIYINFLLQKIIQVSKTKGTCSQQHTPTAESVHMGPCQVARAVPAPSHPAGHTWLFSSSPPHLQVTISATYANCQNFTFFNIILPIIKKSSVLLLVSTTA